MIDSVLQMSETRLGLKVRIHVQPRAKRNEIAGVYNGALKIRITASPVDGAANRAVVEYLAGRLGISKSKLAILSGARSRDKNLHVHGMSQEEFRNQLGI